jgi:hypothetical protein
VPSLHTRTTTDTQLCASQGRGKSSANLNALDESKEGEETTDATTADGTATRTAVLTEVPLSDAPSLQRNRSQSSSVVQMEEKRVELTKKQAKAAKSDLPLAPLSRLWGLNKPDAFYVLVGLAGAFITGSLFPIEGIVIANIQVCIQYTDYCYKLALHCSSFCLAASVRGAYAIAFSSVA